MLATAVALLLQLLLLLLRSTDRLPLVLFINASFACKVKSFYLYLQLSVNRLFSNTINIKMIIFVLNKVYLVLVRAS